MDPALVLEQAVLSLQKPMKEALARGDSIVGDFYKRSTILVTGGTGFLGKLLIEKLIRTCDIKRIYVLIRPKKGSAPEKRLVDILNDSVFDGVRDVQPDFADKITPVEGDASELKLGIKDDDLNTLVNEVDIIIHMAANIRFDVSLKDVVLSNVRGTREALELGKACKKLRAFVHMSTAFSYATRSTIGKTILEEFGETPIPPEALIQMAESLSAKKMDEIAPALMEEWPNTYTFSKALSEETVRRMSGDLPICIIRPAVVISTYIEPVPGWVDMSNLYGPSGIIMGVLLGMQRMIFVNPKYKIELIPADMTTNATIVAAWATATKRVAGYKKIDIYTVTSTRNPYRWNMAKSFWSDLKFKFASSRAMWYVNHIDVRNKRLFTLLTWLFHYMPAYILDGLQILVGKKRRFVKLYEKSYKLSSVTSYFSCNEWYLSDCNLKNLYSGLSQTDKEIYNFDITTLDWKEMIYVWWIGIRKYLIQDGLRDTIKGNRWQLYYYVANLFLNFIVLFAMFMFFKWLYTLLI